MNVDPARARTVDAVHGRQAVTPDTPDEIALSDRLRRTHSREELLDLAARHALEQSEAGARMRRAVWRALAKRFGHGVRIGRAALATHPETFEIGDAVFIGEQAFIGVGAVLRDQITIGERALVGAGAVVLRDVEPDSVYAGNPARRLTKSALEATS